MDYAIVGVFLNNFDQIKGFYVVKVKLKNNFIHLSNLDVVSERDMVQAINNGYSVHTALWDYKGKRWQIGSSVHVYNGNSLRANPNCKLVDNLLSLPHFY
ncbi:hypothetical protein ACILDU_11330 [Capnocytophaga canimorsus]|uniref:hypothetical protein n=1 Tax=Capnocytophaga canimorsus TaxID=28188 RepID=UPI0037D880E3